jgi:hypothetical protein
MRDMLIQLIAQNKEQQNQVKTMNLMLEEVLAQQTNIVNKLHATEMPPGQSNAAYDRVGWQ